MHKLERSNASTPNCLVEYDYQSQNWDDLGNQCKREIRSSLVQMQGVALNPTEQLNKDYVRCAYCEGRIYAGGHIEHFRRKGSAFYPELTFVWENLFLACDSNQHCGHYKDRKDGPEYDPDQLIKPDEHNPEFYLHFHVSGQVHVRLGLDAKDIQRAEETIRVFGLNSGALVGARANALKIYKDKLLADLDELATWPPEDRQAYLTEEIEQTSHEAYATTIAHFLKK